MDRKREEGNGMRAGAFVIRLLYITTGAVFLPVLFCVIFIGNRMNYNDGLKLGTLLPNYLLFLMALAAIAAICLLARRAGKIRLTPEVNRIFNLLLAGAFVLLFFLNLFVTKEIVFVIPWDIQVVSETAVQLAEGNKLGYSIYFSMYSNNIPITYILMKLYAKTSAIESYPYISEFIWLQVSCALISAGGFFGCLAVKKLTGEFAPTILAFLLYTALAGISPWKIAPYTDTYGMVFPIMSVYFYLCYRDAKGAAKKFLFIALALVSGTAGGLIKPSVFLVILAMIGVEFAGLLMNRKNWKYFLTEIVLAAALLFARGRCMDYMMDEMGLDFNPEIEAGWQNYFYMGLNEESTGSYHSGDVTLFGEFQTDRRERNAAALERAFARMKERGILGSLYFWLRKMTMVFNDGTFGWRGEVWMAYYYPQNLASGSRMTEYLRNVFWPDAANEGGYNTFAQLAWICCIIGIAGLLFCPGRQKEKYAVIVAGFMGIFLYQMLFEARARYLFVFLPLLGAAGACGVWQYVSLAAGWRQRRKALRQTEAAPGVRETKELEKKGKSCDGREQENASEE